MRPVGEPIPLFPGTSPAVPESWPAGFQPVYVQSGTAALGLGLKYLRERQGRSRGSVIIPAYGCPDLVSAAQYAGLSVVLCDLQPESPFLEQEDLARKLDRDVVAVVGTNFLGLREDIEGLSSVCAAAGVPLVEDSAQRLPENDAVSAADAAIYSFGRGKPVSGFGGGVLLLREPAGLIPGIHPHAAGLSGRVISRLLPLVIAARNWCLSDFGYRMISAIPASGVGQVRFKPLDQVQRLEAWRLELARALLPIRSREAGAVRHRAGRIAGILKNFSGPIVDLPASLGQQETATLLRYPILLPDRASRDHILSVLEKDGLGASAFYGRAMADLYGLPPVSGIAPEAARFADRLLTLPVHSGVSDRSLRRLETALASLLA